MPNYSSENGLFVVMEHEGEDIDHFPIAAFVDHYNNHRYHESIGKLTPADVYFGRGETILAERRRIKHQTIQNRRLNHQRQAA